MTTDLMPGRVTEKKVSVEGYVPLIHLHCSIYMLRLANVSARFAICPNEVIRMIMDFMTVDEVMEYRHASAHFLRWTTMWEREVVLFFVKKDNMTVAHRLFQNLALEVPMTLKYLLSIAQRFRRAEKLAVYLSKYRMPATNDRTCSEWFPMPTRGIKLHSSKVDKLRDCLLIQGHFFESLLAELANDFTTEDQKPQRRPEVSAFLEVEAAVLNRYTPSAIHRILGVHEWLFAAIFYKIPTGRANHIGRCLLEAFFFAGHSALDDVISFIKSPQRLPIQRLYSQLSQATTTPVGPHTPLPIHRQLLPQTDLGTARKISSILPAGYVRHLGSGWWWFLDRDDAFAKFRDYMQSAEVDADALLVQDTLVDRSEAEASPESSPILASESGPTSTFSISTTYLSRHMRRPKRPSALTSIGQS